MVKLIMTAKNNFNMAIFHAFFTHKGGGEKFVFGVRAHFKADLFASAIDFKNYSPSGNDTFSKDLFDKNYNLEYLHKDSGKSLFRLLKRLCFFLFSPKIKLLLNYNIVLFSGNVMFVQRRLRRMMKKNNSAATPRLVMYCHTPPRKLTDQFSNFISNAPWGLKTLYRLGGKFVFNQYIKDMKQMDFIGANSAYTQKRLLDFTGINSTILYGPADVEKFKYISQGNYFLSYARLDDNKRIPLIIDAFEKMPDKKLVLCSTGPLHNAVKESIEKRNLKNIMFEGLVTDEKLSELVGNCLAGIYIPVNEDLGLTQIEIMSAGKPVIGVKEGGLLETVVDGKTGILIKSNPTVDDLVDAVNCLTPQKAADMKDDCIARAQKFSSQVFFNRIENELNKLSA
jgi:glycosyltransferase involved in cell wall biosynthesis